MKLYVGSFADIDTKLFKSRAKRAAHFVAIEAERDMRNLVPAYTGRLRDSATVDGRKVQWITPYAGVLYYGVLMIDPGWQSVQKDGSTVTVGRKGGFPYTGYGENVFRSRRNVKKIRSTQQLKYNVGDAKWIQAGKDMYTDKWAKMAARALLE